MHYPNAPHALVWATCQRGLLEFLARTRFETRVMENYGVEIALEFVKIICIMAGW